MSYTFLIIILEFAERISMKKRSQYGCNWEEHLQFLFVLANSNDYSNCRFLSKFALLPKSHFLSCLLALQVFSCTKSSQSILCTKTICIHWTKLPCLYKDAAARQHMSMYVKVTSVDIHTL